MQLIRPWWALQLKGRPPPSSTGTLIVQPTMRIRSCRVAYRTSVPGRWYSKAASSKEASLEQTLSKEALSKKQAFVTRLAQVTEATSDPYPRFETPANPFAISEFIHRYSYLANKEFVDFDQVTVTGRVRTYRLAGSGLIFFDIYQDGHKVQILCNLSRLERVGVSKQIFKRFYRMIRRGDAFSITGKPHRTERGELSIVATDLPQLLSPCLHDIPLDAHGHENSPYPRHVQMLGDPATVKVIKSRSLITQHIRQFLLDKSFMEVSTPILNGIPGGASARPFYTSATEFPDRQLALRIAPELWLKRLVVGGFDRVFEIGPSFRNEGLDKTHNPEFTTCEFYQAYSNLEELMNTTEELLCGLAQVFIAEFNKRKEPPPTAIDFTIPFHRIDFITGIELGIDRQLPDLTAPDSLEQVTQIFTDLKLQLPEHPTLPRLLDELCSIYVEPQCVQPTFIINPPECLSPLSKSFVHPDNNQRVAARAELFIEGKEIANMYEEENSPWEQRRKFEDQLKYSKDANEPGEIDEEYLRALEWGLPPTGGWGCGIDRLVMLFTKVKKIAEVLPFGNLRHVTRR
ncbi:putative lysyl-tRNA synthetase [Aspergillus foveolatus]|uniref:putative lysyl-tRNA synthetase n=1 Tax=Aspergillus foveolatus TaxID=210207 RepID=UPI003CCCD41B